MQLIYIYIYRASSGGIEEGEELPRTRNGMLHISVFEGARELSRLEAWHFSGLQGQENSNILCGVQKRK